MSFTKLTGSPNVAANRRRTALVLLSALGLLGAAATSLAQGTMTFTFEGQPRGTEGQVSVYREAGMQFGNLTPQTDYLSGGGIPGYPDNGTGYLEIPAGTLRFGFNAFPETFPLVLFNLLSFDAAEYDSAGPHTLTFVGYLPMAGTVTNYFTVSSQTFQTFHLDSRFTGIFQVDVLHTSWSLDNLVISGVPEPPAGALVFLGVLCALGPRWRRSRRSALGDHAVTRG
jgi:hypothetical protein